MRSKRGGVPWELEQEHPNENKKKKRPAKRGPGQGGESEWHGPPI